MGSRTLPSECAHGQVIDWGDFGPQNEPADDAPWEEWAVWRSLQCPPCPDCETEDAARTVTVALSAPGPIDDALFERVMDQVMTGLCALSDVGIDVGISSTRNQHIEIDLMLGDGWTGTAGTPGGPQ